MKEAIKKFLVITYCDLIFWLEDVFYNIGDRINRHRARLDEKYFHYFDLRIEPDKQGGK